MKIARVIPPAEPKFSLTFSRDEGWAIAMALWDAYTRYPEALDREQWKSWASELNAELRRG